MADQFLTIAEVSARTGENIETLKKRCQAGLISGAHKKGKTWFIPEAYVLGLSRPTAGIYIDGANILHGGLEAGWLIDPTKTIAFIKKRFSVVIQSYYDSVGYEKDENSNLKKDETGNYLPKESQLKFHNYLKGIGFRIVSKPLKFIDNNPGKPKNNMDSYLTLDAIKEQNQWDVFILFSGDCDFDRLVTDLIAAGKNIHIFSFNKRLSHELRTKAFTSPSVSYTELDNLKKILESTRKKFVRNRE